MHGVEADGKPNMCRDAVGPQHHVVRRMGRLHTPTNGWDHWKQPQGFLDHCLSRKFNNKLPIRLFTENVLVMVGKCVQTCKNGS